jgi:ElaB/YqjD/DUF883 family membrane-anchored ribosome-binding protein
MDSSEQLALWAREYQRLADRWGYRRDLPDHATTEALLTAIAADGNEAVDHIRSHAEATLRGKNDQYSEEEAGLMVEEFRADVEALRQYIEEHSH